MFGKRFRLWGVATACALSLSAQQKAADSFYRLSSTTLNGAEYPFEQLKGKYVLIVNTASKCGFTKQYADLQRLSETYPDKLVVLGFPCNQFGKQEPGSSKDIEEFCSVNYGVTFTIMEKSDVKGEQQNAVYRWLTDKSLNGWNEEVPSWNFCKYLVSPEGQLLKFFPSAVNPMSEKITSVIAVRGNIADSHIVNQ
ncbi:MAG: glutathione peroxidase [Mediterranea sp.]|jgi:glutathione peroxidase|nr:glutathione peroxidase [Mediterranea sp.]